MTRKHLILVLLAVWLVAHGASFASYAVTSASGDGFTRGMNRVMVFLGWQAAAGVLGIILWTIARPLMKRSLLRRVSWLPPGLAAVLFGGILVLWLYVVLVSP